MCARAGNLAVHWEPPDSTANPRAVVRAGQARFTILTPALMRLEWSPTDAFEDRPSLVFLNRRLPVPEFHVSRRGGRLTIETDELTLRYREADGKFAADNLSIELSLNGRPIVWRPGTPDTGNLGGTVCTLDALDGACPLDPGLLSRDGWTLVDDSARPLFGDGDWAWPQSRPDIDALDWYFFGYGYDYARWLRDFTRLAGRVPLPPRFVFGSWWSRYWPR